MLSRQRYIALTSSRLLDFLPHLDKRTCIILVPLVPLTGPGHLIGDAEDIHANVDSIGVDAPAEGIGKPVVLLVDVRAAEEAGKPIMKAGTTVYVTSEVLASCLRKLPDSA